MSICLGALHDLERLVHTHLFVIAPNNSGSTFLRNAIATSAAAWQLPREGQHCLGFHGPSTQATGALLIWASRPEWIRLFSDRSAYNWPANRRAWYFQAFSRSPEASVLVVGSPPFLLNVAALDRNFTGARFLFMVRNPYAVVEGICRRRSNVARDVDLLSAAARHVLTCMRRQRENIETWRESGIFFTYEEMCADPYATAGAIRALVPALTDLNLDQPVPVKGMYNSAATDMNQEQIKRLPPDQIARLSEIFAHDREVLEHFGYPIL